MIPNATQPRGEDARAPVVPRRSDSPDLAAIDAVLDAARARGRSALLESEGLALLDAVGLRTPGRIVFADARAAEALGDPPVPGERAVLKALVPGLLHKTEAGAVRVVPNHRGAIAAAAAEMERRLAGQALAGFMLCEFVPHEPGFGHEFLLSLRWSRDFGPVVTLGPGGIHAEFVAGSLAESGRLAVLTPGLGDARAIGRAIEGFAPARLVTSGHRGQPPELASAALADALRRFLSLAAARCPQPIEELEVNPLVVSHGALVALDAVVTLARGREPERPGRPLAKIRHLLNPGSIAVVGVSEKLNPGRIILMNILREGFDPERVVVVKPATDRIEGCRCVPDLGALPEPVDLIVLSVAAPQAAAMLEEIAGRRLAESVVLIPGGLEEKAGTGPLVARVSAAIAASRSRADRGPVVNGGNCLGIRSVPGRFSTLFIPEHKLPLLPGAASPVALITGSGAFAVSKISKLACLNPRYTITVGNQMDLTVADYLEYLRDDPEVRVFGVYLEGFQPRDGARFLSAAAAITARGGTVVLYRAGRTPAGAAAAASHTAAVAGDSAITRPLAESAGVVVAESLEDFEDLVRLFAMLGDRPAHGMHLGAVSNAGYECVAIADSLGPFELARFAEPTTAALRAILERARLESIVTLRNPLDVTPILADEPYEAVVRAILSDPGVDAALVGCVPLTGALETLAAGSAHGEDLRHEGSIARRLARLRDEGAKPWVAVVDAGRLYDPLADALEAARIPVFRTADRALRVFGRYCLQRNAGAPAPPSST
jgi:acyl-CoA synthetase (NDP forming)